MKHDRSARSLRPPPRRATIPTLRLRALKVANPLGPAGPVRSRFSGIVGLLRTLRRSRCRAVSLPHALGTTPGSRNRSPIQRKGMYQAATGAHCAGREAAAYSCCVWISGYGVSRLALLSTHPPTLERGFLTSPYRRRLPSRALNDLLYLTGLQQVPPCRCRLRRPFRPRSSGSAERSGPLALLWREYLHTYPGAPPLSGHLQVD